MPLDDRDHAHEPSIVISFDVAKVQSINLLLKLRLGYQLRGLPSLLDVLLDEVLLLTLHLLAYPYLVGLLPAVKHADRLGMQRYSRITCEFLTVLHVVFR